MTGRPSAFGKKLIHILCPGSKPMESCHCARFIYGMFDAQLTPPIKSALAAARLKFDHTTYKEFFKIADEAWLANGGSDTPSAVVAAVAEPSAPTPSTDGAAAAQVAAATRGNSRGRGNRGFRGGRGRGTFRGGQNNQSQNQNQQNQRQNNNSNNQNSSSYNPKPHQRGPRHPDGPPDSSCSRHWSQGRSATYCSDPLVCGWSNIIAPRVRNNN